MMWSVVGIIIAVIVLGPIILGATLVFAMEVPSWLESISNVQISLPEDPMLGLLCIIAMFALILLTFACYLSGFFMFPGQLKEKSEAHERYGRYFESELEDLAWKGTCTRIVFFVSAGILIFLATHAA